MRIRRRRWAVSVLAAAAAQTGCTTFGAIRSAEVRPGPAASFQLTVTSPVGDEPGWFWSYECSSGCDHVVVAPELGFTWGIVDEESTPAAVGVGLSGLFPFVDVYAQLRRGERPWGLGGRIGSLGTWHEIQVYGRYDAPAGENQRLLWNPSLFIVTGNSPNGANPGHIIAMIQSVGIEARGERVSFVPSASLLLGRGSRTSYSREIGPFNAFFGVISVRMTVNRRHPPR